VVGYSRVCVKQRISKSSGGTRNGGEIAGDDRSSPCSSLRLNEWRVSIRNSFGHVPVPNRCPSGCLGWVGAGDARVRRPTDPAGKRHGNKWLTAMLIEAAGSVGRMHNKNYLAVKHARITRRRGMRRALAPPLPRVARRVACRSSPHGRALTGEPLSQELRSWAVSRCASKNFVICRCGFLCPQGGGRVTG
jgi:hypothetical protein